MQARHNHPALPDGKADYINKIIERELTLGSNLCLAQVDRLSMGNNEPELVTVYLHKIQSFMQATTDYITYPDTYAIIADGTALLAYNIGGSPSGLVTLFDKKHYDQLINRSEKLAYVTHTCLGTVPLRSGSELNVVDQHLKKSLDYIMAG